MINESVNSELPSSDPAKPTGDAEADVALQSANASPPETPQPDSSSPPDASAVEAGTSPPEVTASTADTTPTPGTDAEEGVAGQGADAEASRLDQDPNQGDTLSVKSAGSPEPEPSEQGSSEGDSPQDSPEQVSPGEQAAEQEAAEERAAEQQAAEEEAVEEEAVEEGAVEEGAVEEEAVELAAASDVQSDDDPEVEDVEPLELIEDADDDQEVPEKDWYILKVQVNREPSICEALQRRIKVAGLDRFIGDILVPTEDVREFTKSGKQKVVKRKLYPGYIVVHMAINDDTWFLVRETPGIGDFTGSAGKPTPMAAHEIDRILRLSRPPDDQDSKDIKSVIKFKQGDRVRVKDGHFQNFEGEIDSIDETHGRVTVMINIFGRPTPVELEHWQVEDV